MLGRCPSARVTFKNFKIFIKVEMDIVTPSVQTKFYCGHCDAVCPNQTLPRISRRCLSRAKEYIIQKITYHSKYTYYSKIQNIHQSRHGYRDAVYPNYILLWALRRCLPKSILPRILRRCLSRANYIIHLQTNIGEIPHDP